jgi:hypothetical protein
LADLPVDVRSFLVERVHSLLTLDLLLLMRADPARRWSLNDLSRELRCGQDWLNAELPALVQQTLVREAEPGTFSYNPSNMPADSILGWLANAYPQWRFSIIQAIYGRPDDPVRSFADAFRLRKERPDG